MDTKLFVADYYSTFVKVIHEEKLENIIKGVALRSFQDKGIFKLEDLIGKDLWFVVTTNRIGRKALTRICSYMRYEWTK